MSEARTTDRLVESVRHALSRLGRTLDAEAAAALRAWVGGLVEADTPGAVLKARVERLLASLAKRGGRDGRLDAADVRACIVLEASSAAAAEHRTGAGGRAGGLERGRGFGFIVPAGGDPDAGRMLESAGAAPPERPPPTRSTRAAPRPGTRAAPPLAEREGASAPPEVEPPSGGYALLDAPDAVAVGTGFDAAIGLAAEQSAGVAGDRLELPADTRYPYTLSLQLVAEGFELADGGAWRREVTATRDAPYPHAVFRLRAEAQTEAVRPRMLRVLYSVAGQTIGSAVRPIVVVRSAELLGSAPAPAPAQAVDLGVPTERVAPDLTIHVLRDEGNRHRLLWTLTSPHAGVAGDDDRPSSSDIGDQPREFARQLVQQVNLQEGKPTLGLHMRGLGRRIAANMPQRVWQAVHAAAEAAGGPPSILLLCDEAYIPWELALVPDPLPVADAPPFLGAQANVGRWVFGHPTPPLPPPHELSVSTMAVVWGVYDSSRWARLEAAEQEADALKEVYGASSVDARMGPVLECLEGRPPAEALHFAIHGIYNPGGVQDGFVLVDDSTISPLHVAGADLPGRPLVFLNACQVGSAQEVLGDFAGMASAFLDARASAVVAPLWSVKDTIAKEISLRFYERAFAGEPVAAVLRRERARYGQDDSATYLAYQFFGHPQLCIRRAATPSTPD
jgi:hypothetical protein